MARGWQSQSVEAQIELAEARSRTPGAKPLSAAEAESRRRRDSLGLARARVLQQLQGDLKPRHRAILEAALADLDKKISPKS
jgi:hypothetical protein